MQDRESTPDDTNEFEDMTSFNEMVDIAKWQKMEEYFENSDELISKDVEACVNLRAKLREELLADPDVKKRVRKISVNDLEIASHLLFSGEVCAVDGTVSIVPSQSGGRARIGVAAVSYAGEGIKRVLYVSYKQLAQPCKSAIEYFTKLKKVNRCSALLMRAVMIYAERELALRQPQAWKFVHGEILPYELWAGLGRGRPVSDRLDLASRLIQAKNIIGIVEGTHNIELLNAGEILDQGEYMEARFLRDELREYLGGHRDDGRGAHFNQADRAEFERFIDRHGTQIQVGVFKSGPKSYIFQAHKDKFDEAAALILKDSAHQPMRGFPLLIDYADRICSYNLKSSEFDRQIQFKTARFGWEALATEIDPRKTRRP
jgi:hypothetical protein